MTGDATSGGGTDDARAGGRTAALVASVAAYRLALDAAYFLFLEPRYRHLGFTLDVDWAKVAESWVLMLAMAVLVALSCSRRRASDVLVVLLFAIPIVPVLSMYGLRDEPRVATYLMLGSYAAVLLGRLVPFPKVPRVRTGAAIALAVCAVGVVASLAWILARGGLENFTLDWTAVYDFRARATAAASGGLFAYLIVWSFKVFNLVLIAWSLHRRKWAWLAAALVAQVALFGLTLHKSVLFYPALVVGLYALDRLRLPDHALVWTLAGLSALGVVLYVTRGEAVFPSLLVRRVVFTPAVLDYAYYDFFGRAGHVLMSNGVLGRFFTYPFDLAPPQLIGRYLYDLPRMSANTGFLGTGYMHFGAWGAIGFGLVVGWLLSVSDALAKGRLPRWLGLSVVIAPFFSVFTSSDLPTSMLTHGIVVGLVMLWLLSSAEEPAGPTAPACAPVDREQLGRVLDRLGLAAGLLVFAALAGRLPFGIDPGAESTFAAMVRRFAEGGRPFVDELGGGQAAAVLFVPFAKAWHAVAGWDGLVIGLRGAHLALAAGAVVALAAALTRWVRPAVALPAAAAAVALLSGSVTASGGAHLAATLTLLTAGLVLLALDERRSRRLRIACGAGAGLVALASIAPGLVAWALAGADARAQVAAYALANTPVIAGWSAAELAVREYLGAYWPLLVAAALAWFAHVRGRRAGAVLVLVFAATLLPWADTPARTLGSLPVTLTLFAAMAALSGIRPRAVPTTRLPTAFALAAGACAIAVAYQFAVVPGDASIGAQAALVADGPYAGLWTTAERAGALESLRTDLVAAGDGPLTAFDDFPAAYLLAPGTAAGPAVGYRGNMPGGSAGLAMPHEWFAARGTAPRVAVIRLSDALGTRIGAYGWSHPMAEYVHAHAATVTADTEDYRIVTLRP
ncbi:MAG: hypothetical protein FDZ70_07675 [Actinobacteria bacterium]|nr:MAG: hypothetical protein FDZ70_07675 [Actinomycetota bacterium]